VANPYETKRYLEEYLFFHYGSPRDFCPFPFVPRFLLHFHERIRKECLLPIERGLSARSGEGPIRALDLGCAVGRFTFELARVADEALGLDNSRIFIRAACHIAKARAATVRVKESGAELKKYDLVLPNQSCSAKVRFHVADALHLAPFLRARSGASTLQPSNTPTLQRSDAVTLRRSHAPVAFQIVAAINLICRLPSPRRFLRELPGLVAPGGQLIIASPFSWLEEYTPRREWLSPGDLESFLAPHFRIARRRDLPFLIREHRRKYQLVVSNVLTFQRK
jgi:SAM-dependent methyltransferase